ncbi:hypothetical protein N657DRAFT_369624 [Parathielavia appendiculata]|uniref:Uncharacterized protein n=1 Tax=Parathielavia appendiculata TaxID=2587402 RepID=A0AAN6TQ17_9PEZI|nr:hypothetical protein N657DRAFT_369624 [Parathielavia appendiculata]
MLIGRLVFVARDTPNSVPGEELLKIPILAALSLAVHKLGRPGPSESTAEVAPQQLDTVPLPREDAGVVLDIERLQDQQGICVCDVLSTGAWCLQAVPWDQNGIVPLIRRVSYCVSV